MKKFILYDANTGVIKSIQEPSFENAIGEGFYNNNTEVKEVDYGLDNQFLFENCYWSIENNKLVEYPETQPNYFYFWNGISWVFKKEDFLKEVRNSRNIKLVATDWMVLPDSPIDYATKEAILVYRQLLRDFPSTLTGDEDSLEDLKWPINPMEG